MDYYSEEKEILIEERKKVRRETALLYIQARKKRNLTQEELAKRLEVKRPNVARFESGDTGYACEDSAMYGIKAGNFFGGRKRGKREWIKAYIIKILSAMKKSVVLRKN